MGDRSRTCQKLAACAESDRQGRARSPRDDRRGRFVAAASAGPILGRCAPGAGGDDTRATVTDAAAPHTVEPQRCGLRQSGGETTDSAHCASPEARRRSSNAFGPASIGTTTTDAAKIIGGYRWLAAAGTPACESAASCVASSDVGAAEIRDARSRPDQPRIVRLGSAAAFGMLAHRRPAPGAERRNSTKVVVDLRRSLAQSAHVPQERFLAKIARLHGRCDAVTLITEAVSVIIAANDAMLL